MSGTSAKGAWLNPVPIGAHSPPVYPCWLFVDTAAQLWSYWAYSPSSDYLLLCSHWMKAPLTLADNVQRVNPRWQNARPAPILDLAGNPLIP